MPFLAPPAPSWDSRHYLHAVSVGDQGDGTPRSLWLRARALGDEPEQQWTFPLLANRAIASDPDGLTRSYEHLRTWEEVAGVLTLTGNLVEHGLPQEYAYFVNLGLELFDGVYYAPAGNLQLPRRREPFRGRHSVGAFALDGERLVFQNSWGQRWGDRGIGYISRDYFETHVDLVLVSRSSVCGPSPAMASELARRRWRSGHLTAEPSARELVEAWLKPSPFRSYRVDHRGEQLAVATRTLTSATGLRMDVLEARSGRQFIGRVHLHHGAGLETVADEFWVTPVRRRQGYGGLLLGVAETIAREEGAESLRLLLHETDAARKERGRGFATAMGYTWTEVAERRPNLVGVADKSLMKG